MNIDAQPAARRLLINLGCGPAARPTCWMDCDGSWNVLASRAPLGSWARGLLGQRNGAFPPHVRYVDVTRRLPFAESTADAVYFSHLLEHLYHDDGQRLLRESWRILKPDGVIRVVVPDTEHHMESYRAEKSRGEEGACLRLNERLMYRPLTSRRSLVARAYTALTDFHSHKFMYDRPYLASCLRAAGFTDVSERQFRESRIAEVTEVENEGRVGDGAGFAIEAVKPAKDANPC